MILYKAPNPYQKKQTSFFSSLFSSSSSISSSESIGALILPAQRKPVPNVDYAYRDTEIDSGKVITYDGVELETAQITPEAESKKPDSEKYYVVKYNGNYMLYQDRISELLYDANSLNCTVVSFNYRNVGNSSKKPPKTFAELVVDGIAQIQRLLDSGVDSKKITLDGISLGGAVAVMVAHYFHKKHLPVYLWVDRSLASVSKAAAGMLAPAGDGLCADITFSSSESTSYSLLKPTGWQENIAKAYLEIPDEYKSYMVVAKKSEKTHSVGDGVLDRSALHYGVKDAEKKRHVRTGHKVLSFSLYGGHNDSRKNLVSKENPEINGQQLFENFVLKHRR